MGIPAPFGIAASGLPPPGDQANAVLAGTILGIGVTQPFAFRGPMNLFIWASVVTALTTTAGSLSASVASGTGLAAGSSIKSANVPPGTIWGAFSGTSGTLSLPPITQTGIVNVSAPQIAGLALTNGLLGATVTGPGIPSGTTVDQIITPAVAATDQSPGVLGVVHITNTPTSAPVNNAPLPFFTFTEGVGDITVSGADAAASFTGAGVVYVGTVQVERSFDGGYTWLICNIGGAGQLAQFTAGTPVSITFGEPEKQILYRLNCTAYSSGVINYRISQTGGAAESLAIGPLAGG